MPPRSTGQPDVRLRRRRLRNAGLQNPSGLNSGEVQCPREALHPARYRRTPRGDTRRVVAIPPRRTGPRPWPTTGPTTDQGETSRRERPAAPPVHGQQPAAISGGPRSGRGRNVALRRSWGAFLRSADSENREFGLGALGSGGPTRHAATFPPNILSLGSAFPVKAAPPGPSVRLGRLRPRRYSFRNSVPLA